MSFDAPEHSPVELHRLLANIARAGRVEQVSPGNPARCRVRTGELLTDWLPWFTQAAGGAEQTRHWRAPAIGEQCLLLAPGGDLGQAFVLLGMFCEDMPQNGQSLDVERITYGDGTVVEYDANVGVLRIKGPRLIKLQSSVQIVLDCDVYITRNLHVAGSIRSDRSIMGVQGVWPPRPLQVPRMGLNTEDAGVAQ